MARNTFFQLPLPARYLADQPNPQCSQRRGVWCRRIVDALLWEKARSTSDDAVKNLINKALNGSSVTVVFIGSQTAGRKFINYEIDQSIARGNGVLGVRIHNVKDKDGKTDTQGATPSKLTAGGYPVYTYTNGEDLAAWIEAAAKKAGK